MYFCYVLWSRVAGRYYIGISADPVRRLAQHNAGVSRWTRRWAGTWQLVWERSFSTLSEARAFERRLKRQKGGLGFYHLTGLDSPEEGSAGLVHREGVGMRGGEGKKVELWSGVDKVNGKFDCGVEQPGSSSGS